MFRKLFKLILVFLFFFILIFFTKDIQAFQFEKAPENPLPISYINGYAYHQQVHIFKENNIYKGIFVISKPSDTYHSLGYFESVDGISWLMKKEIMNTGIDLSNPRILKTQTGYLLFVTRYDNDKIYRLYLNGCDNDFNCSNSLIPIIIPELTNPSENNGFFAGFPYQQSGRTYLFFGAWGSSGFRIKLAYSDDLTTWQRCPNDRSFLYGDDGPFPYQLNNDLYLFFHHSDSSGIGLAKTALPLSCDSNFEDQGYLLIRDKDYDRYHMVFSSVVDDNYLRLYYSGLGSDGGWHLSLANQIDITPAPTGTIIPTLAATIIPTITPYVSPTLIPTLSPTPSIMTPIIIIPGFLASWNKDAIIHNIQKPQSSWEMNPIVTEYTGIMTTFKNLGYEENKNLYIFNYDWRKPIPDIVNDLNNFINEKIGSRQFKIFGHSLGGLVGRIYFQKYENNNLIKLITVGSPHFGVAQMYKMVEAGEIESFNNYVTLSAKIVLALNKANLETDKNTIARLFPIFKDLFPVYNFLKKDNSEISTKDMTFKNSILAGYNSNLSNWINKSNLANIVGESGNTLKGFNVTSQTIIDRLLDNYPDGRPQSAYYDIGDNTVLSSSARINSPETLNLGHNELVYKKAGIKMILNLLGFSYQENQIIEGKGTTIDSSIVFLIKSPATMSVTKNNKIYSEQDGMIFIENAQNGDYQLKVMGTGKGSYEVIVGQISQNSDVWDNLYGETTASKTDNYDIHYNDKIPKSYFETISIPALFDELINYLKINKNNSLIIKKLIMVKNLYVKNKKSEKMGETLKSIKYETIKNKDFIALEKIENIEMRFVNIDNKQKKDSRIKDIEGKLSKLHKPINQLVLSEIVKRLNQIKNKNNRGNETLLESIKELMKIVQK